MQIDTEEQLQADNGRNVGPLGIIVALIMVVSGVVLSWNWARILTWVAIILFAVAGVGFAIMAMR